jgi:Acetyltransferase (GNAT) domain
MTGYRSAEYAAALPHLGRPLYLPRCDSWLLEREIAESGCQDLVGCYPLFRCSRWNELDRDLCELPAGNVAVSMVVDPYGDPPSDLSATFPDVCRPFKQHFGVDFTRDWRGSISRHHRRNIRAAAAAVEVERSEDPGDWLDTWVDLYGHLASRHEISGAARFSRESFARQLRAPSLVAFRAVCGSETVAMSLWYRDGEVAYYHLGASDPRGYELAATFAIFDVALGHFAATGARWAQLGGAAGWQATTREGLARFKSGWANEQRTAWFCGRVLDRLSYQRLLARYKRSEREFFPSYRQPEAA